MRNSLSALARGEEAISLVIGILVIARAVNILK
jgi:hypothetical protein